MNILVTGANGQLGTEMRILAAAAAHNFIFSDVNDVEGCETTHLDITDASAVRETVMSGNVDVIVNCAAYTNVDKAEDDPQTADLLNRKAVEILAAAAKEAGAVLIHVSTDYVFDGCASVPYREDDAKHPQGVYGVTKLAGEEAVTASGCRYIIFRTAWLYSPFGRNFVKTIRRVSAEKDSMTVVFDQAGTPTYAADLAGLIMKIICEDMLDRQGIYHYSNEGVISWYDFAVAISTLSGNTCDIRPCHTDEYPAKAARPHFSVLDKTKVKDTFGITVPYWLDSLKKCLDRL